MVTGVTALHESELYRTDKRQMKNYGIMYNYLHIKLKYLRNGQTTGILSTY